jgi:hypothetical protein
MTNEEKIAQLYSLKEKIESKEFQEWIMKPIYEELGKMKDAYDCETLSEMHTLKGKKEGIMFLIKLLKESDRQLKNTKTDLEEL